jgi:2,5-diamino-6-(ribosylamino)-4(3H)-pyrimidinone 5'-phosphate reductase
MKPKVVIHTQVSLDGCIRGFEDTGVYYRLAYRFGADMVLFGTDTVLAAAGTFDLPEKESDFKKPVPGPEDSRPLAVVPDSRGRLRNLHFFRNMEYLKDVIVLVSHATPKDYLDYLKERNYDFITAGEDHVDFKQAFDVLHTRYHCRTIRTDCGGTLTGVLLEQGLADEISLVVSPCLVGKELPHLFQSLSLRERIPLELVSNEVVDGNYLSLVYRILGRP